MTKPQVAPYGSWKSPITSDMIASGTIRLEQVVLDRNDIYWIEMRPSNNLIKVPQFFIDVQKLLNRYES